MTEEKLLSPPSKRPTTGAPLLSICTPRVQTPPPPPQQQQQQG